MKLRTTYPWRVVAFAEALIGPGVPQRWILDGAYGHHIDVILTRESYPHQRFGSAHVACACQDYGHKRVGGSLTLLWGRNTKTLLAYVEQHRATFSPLVVLALMPGTKTTAGPARKVLTLLRGLGHTAAAVEFTTQTVIQTDVRLPEAERIKALRGMLIDP